MLNPIENRLDYSQILAPLDDYELDFAIGTTYSLDFEALIGACVALGLSAETDSKLLQDSVYLLSLSPGNKDSVSYQNNFLCFMLSLS